MMKGPYIQTSPEAEGLVAKPQPLVAANDEFAQQPQPSSTAGWDPFEVWRTRVKAAQAQETPEPANSIA
jgi:hypothetical protein